MGRFALSLTLHRYLAITRFLRVLASISKESLPNGLGPVAMTRVSRLRSAETVMVMGEKKSFFSSIRLVGLESDPMSL